MVQWRYGMAYKCVLRGPGDPIHVSGDNAHMGVGTAASINI